MAFYSVICAVVYGGMEILIDCSVNAFGEGRLDFGSQNGSELCVHVGFNGFDSLFKVI